MWQCGHPIFAPVHQRIGPDSVEVYVKYYVGNQRKRYAVVVEAAPDFPGVGRPSTGEGAADVEECEYVKQSGRHKVEGAPRALL